MGTKGFGHSVQPLLLGYLDTKMFIQRLQNFPKEYYVWYDTKFSVLKMMIRWANCTSFRNIVQNV